MRIKFFPVMIIWMLEHSPTPNNYYMPVTKQFVTKISLISTKGKKGIDTFVEGRRGKRTEKAFKFIEQSSVKIIIFG